MAEVSENIVNNLFQQPKPEELAQTKKKEIFTGSGGRFVSKETKGAKSKIVDTISSDIKLKRAEEKSQKNRVEKLRQMIAENKAKKQAQTQEIDEEPAETTEMQLVGFANTVGKTENSNKKGEASRKKAKSSHSSPAETDLQPEETYMMNPAEFSLPNVMYSNIGTAESPIMQAFTSGRCLRAICRNRKRASGSHADRKFGSNQSRSSDFEHFANSIKWTADKRRKECRKIKQRSAHSQGDKQLDVQPENFKNCQPANVGREGAEGSGRKRTNNPQT